MTEVNREAVVAILDKLIAERNELRVLAARLDREVDARDARMAELVEAGNEVARLANLPDEVLDESELATALARWREVAG